MMRHQRFLTIGTFVLLGLNYSAHSGKPEMPDSFNDWLAAENSKAQQALFSNISRADTARGAVVASPSKSDPNYYYHWIRDAALTMSVVESLYETSNGKEKTRYFSTLEDYIHFSRQNQLTPNPSGGPADTGLGEPKFNVDGSPFNAPWGRPQNDGPALRAITLTRFANALIREGRQDFVRQYLYDSTEPTQTLIKSDLEYVSHHWQDASFDLWEEVRGEHFYTEIVQRRAMLVGAQLADLLNDSGAASWYRQQAAAIESRVMAHWDDSQHYFRETLNWGLGLLNVKDKQTNLDTGIILGVLHSAGDDGFLSVIDDRVLSTAELLRVAFQQEYSINQVTLDREQVKMGTAIGRYPGDRYCGCSNGGIGNPWILATTAFAELNYRLAAEYTKRGEIQPSALNLPFFSSLNMNVDLRAGETISMKDPRFARIINALHTAGDSYLRRVKYHSFPTGALSEQFNRDTGFMQSAADLTWSYASYITAYWAR